MTEKDDCQPREPNHVRLARFFRNHAPCPNCCNLTLEEGECVDVGVGLGMKISPDRCEWCGWSEDLNSFDAAQLGKCWELQVSPYPGYL